MNKILDLNINDQCLLEIVTELDDLEYVSNLYNTLFKIYLQTQRGRDLVMRSCVGYDLHYIAERIEGCLQLQRYIPSILGHNMDLGLLWHQHWQKVAIAEDSGNPLSSWKWPGMELYLVENKGSGFDSCITWLYNDENGQIIMQVNNIYPWFFKDAPSPDLDISYDDWLPQYKILYKTIIPKNVAKQWVKDLHGLYSMLELNT